MVVNSSSIARNIHIVHPYAAIPQPQLEAKWLTANFANRAAMCIMAAVYSTYIAGDLEFAFPTDPLSGAVDRGLCPAAAGISGHCSTNGHRRCGTGLQPNADPHRHRDLNRYTVAHRHGHADTHADSIADVNAIANLHTDTAPGYVNRSRP